MSYCKKIGKDIIIFASKEDHAKPSTITLPPSEPQAGLILDNGDINWNCPCLGGMATGPCGVEFRSAFSCFHYSENEPKGAECLESFQLMQECMKKFPSLYKQSDGDEGSSEIDKMMPSEPELSPRDEPSKGDSQPVIPEKDSSTDLLQIEPPPPVVIPESKDSPKAVPSHKPPTHGPQLVIENPE